MCKKHLIDLNRVILCEVLITAYTFIKLKCIFVYLITKQQFANLQQFLAVLFYRVTHL